MAYKIILLEEARIEIVEAALFYKRFSRELSDDLLSKFYDALGRISENPELFQVIRKGHRKANLERFPYKVIFRIENNTIAVVAFAHHKRNPGYWKNR
jgi:mRNA-degrading endonuclease RelE of RelBE toxin-antitoxin system